jgi:hypothetical protein
VEFTREKAGPYHESIGTAKLYIGEKVVAQGPMRTQTGKFGLGGGQRVGYQSGDAVSRSYTTPGKFHGGRILGVGVTVEKTSYADLEKEAQAAFARD